MWWRFPRRAVVPPQALLSEAVKCVDEDGHEATLVIGVTGNGQLTLTTPGGETVTFVQLQAGPLRFALRRAVDVAGRLPVGAKVADVHPALANTEACA
jgi:hypothetical protein